MMKACDRIYQPSAVYERSQQIKKSTGHGHPAAADSWPRWGKAAVHTQGCRARRGACLLCRIDSVTLKHSS